MPQNHRKTPLSGPKWLGFGAHPHPDTIAKPLYPVRNWWVLRHTPTPKTSAKPLYQDRNWSHLGCTPHRKTPLSGPKLVGFEAHPTPSQRTETGGFWGAHPHRKTPLTGPKLVGFEAHPHAQNLRKTPL